MQSTLIAVVPAAEQPRARAAVETTAVAMALGLLADLLFREARLGLNAPLWIGALVIALHVTGRHREVPASPAERLCHTLSLAAAAGLAWRASPVLQALLFLASGALLVLAVAVRCGLPWRRTGVALFLGALIAAGISIASGVLRMQDGLRPRGGLLRHAITGAGAALRILAIAVPVLLVFTALFASADAVFEDGLSRLTRFDLSGIIPHVFWLVAGAWFAGGVTRASFEGWTLRVPEPRLPERRRLTAWELAAVLGSLAALFVTFVGIQLRYLFGGHDLVQQTIGLTYAEYARRGFFELVTAAILLLPLLLVADWARRHGGRGDAVFRALAAVLIVCLSIVVASALQRVAAYEEAYGLTEARLYAVAVLLWLGAVFALFLRAVLAGSPAWFVAGSVAAAVAVLAVLTVAAPDGVIARRNVERAATHPFDAAHASRLGADAVPVLVGRMGGLAPADACTVARAILDRWGEGSGDEWRSWNASRAEAAATVAREAERLRSACEPAR